MVAGTQFRTRGGVTYSLDQVTVNPNYDSKNVNNDIAILKVQKRLFIALFKVTNTLCMPTDYRSIPNE